MKKILVIYLENGSLKEIAEGIKKGAETEGLEVDLISTETASNSISFYPYDLAVVGSPTRGIFRGKAAGDLISFFKKCKNTMGQKTVAFVTPRFFATGKALKDLMNKMEQNLGSVVIDFKKLKKEKDGLKFGKSLKDYKIN